MSSIKFLWPCSFIKQVHANCAIANKYQIETQRKSYFILNNGHVRSHQGDIFNFQDELKSSKKELRVQANVI